MSFTARLFIHILQNVYQGNNDRMARDLEIHPSNLRQKHKQLLNGESSPTTLELLIDLCVMIGYDLNKVRDEHKAQSEIHPVTGQPCPYIETMNTTSQQIRDLQMRAKLLKDLLKLYKCADKLLQQMRLICCGENTASSHSCRSYWRWLESHMPNSEDCPCVRLSLFMDWLNREITGLTSVG